MIVVLCDGGDKLTLSQQIVVSTVQSCLCHIHIHNAGWNQDFDIHLSSYVCTCIHVYTKNPFSVSLTHTLFPLCTPVPALGV